MEEPSFQGSRLNVDDDASLQLSDQPHPARLVRKILFKARDGNFYGTTAGGVFKPSLP